MVLHHIGEEPSSCDQGARIGGGSQQGEKAIQSRITKSGLNFLFASRVPTEEAMPDTIVAKHATTVEDVEYQPGMLARLYRPKGAGPFPAALQVHGGAWTSKDRTDNDFIAKALAESGIFVASID